MPSALDASAMLALVRSEPGAEVVDAALALPGNRCYAHYVNLCEVYYARARQDGEDVATEAIRYLIDDVMVVPFESPNPEFYWEVGRLRAFATSERLALSLADCFCLATARSLGCELLTSDHQEFDPLVPLGLCAITFIR
jgi:PIN domain nuclease of toxin-antitoxin system